MALIQWREAFEPFRDLRELQDRLTRVFENRLGAAALGVERGTSTFPPLDIRHDAENVYVVAELPGVTLESLDLSITGDTLSIKGERKAPEVPEDKFHRRERPWGHFNRLVSLPDRVDADKIHAALKDGILRVMLPKAESAKPRTIKVSQS
jgi:HSP20 family protein